MSGELFVCATIIVDATRQTKRDEAAFFKTLFIDGSF